MDGLTDAPMRALQGEFGAFTFAVSEFVRVSSHPIPSRVFRREIPELLNDGLTVTGLPVQVQILGGNPELMAASAVMACQAGARAIDINFGCPAPTVNRNDGGATILQYPERVREIVAAVRAAAPPEIPVSAKVRLGWAEVDEFDRLAEMVADGGADWLVVHCRTKMQRYKPPIFWGKLAHAQRTLEIPVVANGDIWTLDDFKRCRDLTGCEHFMLGRGAIADPGLARRIASDMGIATTCRLESLEWIPLLDRLDHYCRQQSERKRKKTFHRLKQWLNFAWRFGSFEEFGKIKHCRCKEELFEVLRTGAVPECGQRCRARSRGKSSSRPSKALAAEP